MGEDALIAARAIVAARYGDGVTDSLGRFHPSIPARAIREGKWDSSPAIQAVLREAAEGGRDGE